MKRFLGNWAGLIGDEVVRNLSDHFIPAHPLLALFLFLAASLFFFAGLTAFVLGLWMALTTLLPQATAIWTLFGIFTVLTLLLTFIGIRLLRPRKAKYQPPKEPITVSQLVSSFVDGFFNKN
jgi:membrane protein implicated in regulation of membrane protease activity